MMVSTQRQSSGKSDDEQQKLQVMAPLVLKKKSVYGKNEVGGGQLGVILVHATMNHEGTNASLLPRSALQGISVQISPWLTKQSTQELGWFSAGICSV